MSDTLPVSEIFLTIQGEATHSGTPCAFIRLQGCPVGCPWCDTKYTWHIKASAKGNRTMEQILVKDQNDKEPTYTLASPEEIVAAIASLGVIPRHFVITGGEPCLYDLRPLTALLLTHGSVQIETSGTMEIQADPQTWVTVSPKVDMPGGLQVLPSSLARANEVKMPVESMEDIENLLALEGEIDGTIWLQPVSQGKAATDLCVDCCHRFGWRLSIQSHKYIGLR